MTQRTGVPARGFARSTVLYAFATFIPRIGLFLLLPIYARLLTPAEVGQFSLMMSLAGLLAILLRLGMDATLIRFHFQFNGELGRLYATTFSVAVVSAVVLSVSAGLVLSATFSHIFAGIAFLPVGVLALLIGAGNSFQFVPAAWYRATEQAGRYAAMTTATFVISAGLTLWLLGILRAGLEGALVGQLGGAATVVAFAVIVIVRLPNLALDWGLAVRALRFGLPIIPHALSAWVLNVFDRWLLAILLPVAAMTAQAQIGAYWIGYQLGYAVSLLGVSIQAAWLPIVYRQTDPVAGGRRVGAMLVASTAALSVIAVAVGLTAPEVIRLVAGEEYASAVPVVSIVAAASVFYGMYVIAVAVLLHEHRTGTMAAVTLATGVLNIAINVVLIPMIGIVGAAIASLIANMVYGVTTVWLAGRLWPLSLPLRRLGVILAAPTALLIAAAWVGDFVPLALRVAVAGGYVGVAWLLVAPVIGTAPWRTAHHDSGPSSS